MTAKQFVDKYWIYAQESELTTGIPALVVMAQAALETGWGNTVIGNMMFGKKDNDGLNGNEQLLLTTEYITNPDKKFPVIVSITQVGKKLWKYRVKDWFRMYKTPAESFIDHSLLISKAPRYKLAMAVRENPVMFATAIADAGYATDPDYASKLHSIMKVIKQYIRHV